MWYLIAFIFGVFCGLGAKFWADWYVEWKAEQKDLRDRMERWVRHLDALEEIKKRELPPAATPVSGREGRTGVPAATKI
ncbi:MAG: hypothetical protein WC453_02110 [Patescibacteria group bacterium]